MYSFGKNPNHSVRLEVKYGYIYKNTVIKKSVGKLLNLGNLNRTETVAVQLARQIDKRQEKHLRIKQIDQPEFFKTMQSKIVFIAFSHSLLCRLLFQFIYLELNAII